MPATPRPFRWAILGTGPVARKFALALRLIPGAEVAAVASRDPKNARAFAAALGGRPAESYAAAVAGHGGATDDVDAVYVATPPALHEDHAQAAIAAGRAVLVEKPLAADAAAARRIAAAAEAAGVFAMEAMWTRFLPLVLAVRARIAAGAIGEVRGFDGAFLAATRPDAGIHDPARGGGALLDRGVYPVSLARFLLGPVAETKAMARLGPGGVDEDAALVLRHACGALSTVRASLRTAGAGATTIWGTEGTIRLSGPVWRPTGAVLTPVRAGGGMAPPARFEALRETAPAQALSRRVEPLKRLVRGRGQAIGAPLAGSGYQYQAAEVMACVRRGATGSALMPMGESVEILEIVDAARAGWGAP
jgi:predicted dehydrogenase